MMKFRFALKLNLILILLFSLIIEQPVFSLAQSQKLLKRKNIYNISLSLENSVSLDEEKLFSQTFNTGFLLQRNKNNFSIGGGFQKSYPDTVASNENTFTWLAPFIKYSRTGVYSSKYFNLNSIYSKIRFTTPELYKESTEYGTFQVGILNSFPISSRISLSYDLSVSRYFRKYSNGSNGTYNAWALQNVIPISYLISDKISLSAGFIYIATRSYEGTVDGVHLSYISGTYNITKKISLSCGVESSEKNIKYGRDNIRIYHRDNARAFFTLTGAF